MASENVGFERYVETAAGMVNLHWDDESDPQNSVGWIACLETTPGDEKWQPVGPNVAKEWAEIQAVVGLGYYVAMDALLSRTLPEAVEEVHNIYGKEGA